MNHSYLLDEDLGTIPPVVWLGMAFYLFLLLGIVTVFYVLQSYGIYKISKRRGIQNPWLAWIPVAQMWILGSLADQYQYVVHKQTKNKRKTLLTLAIVFAGIVVLTVISVFITVLAGIGTLEQWFSGNFQYVVEAPFFTAMFMILFLFALACVWIAIFAVQATALYDILRSCRPDSAVLFLVLSILFQPAEAIILFLLRDDESGMPPRKSPNQSNYEQTQYRGPEL